MEIIKDNSGNIVSRVISDTPINVSELITEYNLLKNRMAEIEGILQSSLDLIANDADSLDIKSEIQRFHTDTLQEESVNITRK